MKVHKRQFITFLIVSLMMFSLTMCKNDTKFDSYNPYSERYGLSKDNDLKRAMESMKNNENYPILKDGTDESKIHRKYLLELYEKNDFKQIKDYVNKNSLILGNNKLEPK